MRLEDVVIFRNGHRNSETAVADGPFPFYVCSKDVLRSDSYDFDGEAVVMAGNNADGVFHLHYVSGRFAARQRTYVITPKTEQLHCRWLFNQLQLLQPLFQASAIGTTTRYVTIDMLRSALISVPPIPIQRRIASLFDEHDALEDDLTRFIAKKRDLKQAAMQQLLTGRTRLSNFCDEWESRLLREVCVMKSGEAITSESIDEHSQFRCYGGNGVRGFTNRYTHEGDFALIGRQGALCGNVIGARGKFFASEHAIVVAPRTNTDIRWLTLVLQKLNLNQYSESSAQPGLSVAKLLNLRLIVPANKQEQGAIAAVLSDMDSELSALEARREKTRALKQAMMQELLTGRTRLV